MELKEFQKEAVDKIISLLEDEEKMEIVVQAPTGSGKTVILSHVIDEFAKKHSGSYCYFWITPGNGELEEQSREKFKRLTKNCNSKTLREATLNEILGNDVVFINWEALDKKNNYAKKGGETKNFEERIEDCKRKNLKMIIIKDESHTHNTEIAKSVLELFCKAKVVSASATVNKKYHPNIDVDISEDTVIDSGLITKMISINEGIKSKGSVSADETEFLLDLAIEKQKKIEEGYRKEEVSLVPMVIIQYPNEKTKEKAEAAKLMEKVDAYLKKRGYSYENKTVACWLDGNKKNIEEDNRPLSSVVFLHTKQALATGWDCPRAKILVKLRTNSSETFEIQVLGRIRRMPEQRHYDNDLLNYCYLYTFDNKYKESAIREYGGKEPRELRIKEEYADLDLGIMKQDRPENVREIKERDKRDIIFKGFLAKYKLEDASKLSKEKREEKYLNNKHKLLEKGFVFSNDVMITVFEGTVSHIDSSLKHGIERIKQEGLNSFQLKKKYSVSVNKIGSETRLSEGIVESILRKLFFVTNMEKIKDVCLV